MRNTITGKIYFIKQNDKTPVRLFKVLCVNGNTCLVDEVSEDQVKNINTPNYLNNSFGLYKAIVINEKEIQISNLSAKLYIH